MTAEVLQQSIDEAEEVDGHSRSSSYHGMDSAQESTRDEIQEDPQSQATASARRTLANFILMSVLFSANHASVVACLSLATPRLGETGSLQSAILYMTYTGSAVLGATWIVKKLGGRDGIIAGMLLYCSYVGCFWLLTVVHSNQKIIAYVGAAIGGIGAGFLWVAQGSYFASAAAEYAVHSSQDVSLSTSYLAGIFAFIYLGEEVVFKGMSSVLLEVFNVSWGSIFALYSLATIVSTAAMLLVHKYPEDASSDDEVSGWYKVTAAWQLLRTDPKMPYMIGLNAAFGFTSSFLNSYVNGEVVRVVLNDEDSVYIGYLAAWVSIVAATMSLVFGSVSSKVGNGAVLSLGAVCFACVAIPFLVQPDLTKWNVLTLIAIYSFHGTGRATFEGTLKATFADYFAYEKEGAFANIILQNGLCSSVGYFLTFRLKCSGPGHHCAEYHDGTYHDVFSFEMLVLLSCIVAVAGFWRASSLHHRAEDASREEDETDLLENEQGVVA